MEAIAREEDTGEDHRNDGYETLRTSLAQACMRQENQRKIESGGRTETRATFLKTPAM